MGRRSPSASTLICYLDVGGVLTEQVPSQKLGRGSFTLLPGSLYVFFSDGADELRNATQLQWDSSLIITSAKMSRTCFSTKEVLGGDLTTTGGWIPLVGSNIVVETNGAAGVSVTAGVLAATGGAAGGAVFDMTSGARRHRIEVQTGATGGEMRAAAWGKE